MGVWAKVENQPTKPLKFSKKQKAPAGWKLIKRTKEYGVCESGKIEVSEIQICEDKSKRCETCKWSSHGKFDNTMNTLGYTCANIENITIADVVTRNCWEGREMTPALISSLKRIQEIKDELIDISFALNREKMRFLELEQKEYNMIRHAALECVGCKYFLEFGSESWGYCIFNSGCKLENAGQDS